MLVPYYLVWNAHRVQKILKCIFCPLILHTTNTSIACVCGLCNCRHWKHITAPIMSVDCLFKWHSRVAIDLYWHATMLCIPRTLQYSATWRALKLICDAQRKQTKKKRSPGHQTRTSFMVPKMAAAASATGASSREWELRRIVSLKVIVREYTQCFKHAGFGTTQQALHADSVSPVTRRHRLCQCHQSTNAITDLCMTYALCAAGNAVLGSLKQGSPKYANEILIVYFRFAAHSLSVLSYSATKFLWERIFSLPSPTLLLRGTTVYVFVCSPAYS